MNSASTLTPPSLCGLKPTSSRIFSTVRRDGTSVSHRVRIAAESYGHNFIFSESKFLVPPKVTTPLNPGIIYVSSSP